MKYIKKYKRINEAAIRVPRLNARGLQYWRNKGKNGKDVMLYTHDDLDGIYSAIAAREHLEKMGYNIKGYGVLNYMEGWKKTSLDPKMINVAVDFAELPDQKREHLIDIYIDHHGSYTEEEKEHFKDAPVIKTDTGSAYEGIMKVLGKPADEIILYAIDMIDSAKYDDYNVDWRDILDFDWDKFKEIANREGKVTIKPFKKSENQQVNEVTLGWPIIAKLTFAGAFNQFLKRSDHKTLIEVVDNVREPSIYGIYHAMKKLYPGNNVWTRGWSAGQKKDFIKDATWRISTMQKRTRGNEPAKEIFNSQKEFYQKFKKGDGNVGVNPDGYQILGNLMFVPSGTWANALRARAILLKDYDAGVIPAEHQIDFIMLVYGNTIQVCGFKKLEEMDEEDYPVLNDGTVMKDLAAYMDRIHKMFRKYFGYYEPDTSIGQEELTVSGGHVGIGTISNIIGKIDAEKIISEKNLDEKGEALVTKYDGYRYLDLIKNKIISDLSNIPWRLGMKWNISESDDDKNQMIRNIVNHDISKREEPFKGEDVTKFGSEWWLQNRSDYDDKEGLTWEAGLREFSGEGYEKIRQDFINRMKKAYREFLKTIPKDELEPVDNEVMMDYKVMSKDDVRNIADVVDEHHIDRNILVKYDSFKNMNENQAAVADMWNSSDREDRVKMLHDAIPSMSDKYADLEWKDLTPFIQEEVTKKVMIQSEDETNESGGGEIKVGDPVEFDYWYIDQKYPIRGVVVDKEGAIITVEYVAFGDPNSKKVKTQLTPDRLRKLPKGNSTYDQVREGMSVDGMELQTGDKLLVYKGEDKYEAEVTGDCEKTSENGADCKVKVKLDGGDDCYAYHNKDNGDWNV